MINTAPQMRPNFDWVCSNPDCGKLQEKPRFKLGRVQPNAHTSDAGIIWLVWEKRSAQCRLPAVQKCPQCDTMNEVDIHGTVLR